MEFQEKKNPNFLLSTAQPFGMGNPEPSYFLTQPTNVNNSWRHSAKLFSQNIKCGAECTLQSSAVCKCFLQKLHIYLQDSACIRAMCVVRCEVWRNALSHIGHSYGFCPVWTLLWTRAWLGVLNVLSQKPHFSGFSPVWIRKCRARSLAQLKNFLHSVHCTLFFFGNWLRRSSRAWSASFFCTAIINTSNSLTHSTVGHFIFRQDQSLKL